EQEEVNTDDKAKSDEGAREDKKIDNVDTAMEKLEKKMVANDEINEGEIAFILKHDLRIDEKGSYYTFTLKHKGMMKAGGTGFAGEYKIYQDGEYEFACCPPPEE